MGCVYIPPLDSTSTISSFQDNNAFHVLHDDVTHFRALGNVIICGDFNARTGNHPDFISTAGKDNHDFYNAFCNNETYDFPDNARKSEDVKVNKYGRELLDLCKSSNMRIMNGYFNDTTEMYTCCMANGRSLIDYLICDTYCYKKLSTFRIDPLSSDSDHRPLVFSIQLALSRQPALLKIKQQKNNVKFFKYVFDMEKASGLLMNL